MSTKIVLNTKWLEQNISVFELLAKNSPQTVTITKKTYLALVRKESDADSNIDQFVLEERPIDWQDPQPALFHTVIPHTATVTAVVAAVAGGGASTASVLPPSVSPAQTTAAVAPNVTDTISATSASMSAPASASAPAPDSTTPDTVIDVQLFDGPDYWLGDMFVTDLNGDGVDEIIVAGRKSQPSTVQDWQDSYVSVLGWNTGSFANENTKWFEAGNNKILGTEPNVRFGDFDGNGFQDVWVAPSTDMEHYGPGIVYFNDGEKLQRYDVDIGHVWVHDSAVADINNDGFDDIVASSYGPGQVIALGRSDKTFDIYKGAASTNYSGIAAGNFLGDGSVSFVMVDAWGDGVSDTALYQLTVPQPVTGISSGDLVQNQSPVFTQRAVLPADRFSLAKWDHAAWLKQPGNFPHSVRATTMDFNRDGLDDVIISTSASGSDGSWHRYFEMQFLENQGNGVFIDQTDTILLDWDPLTTVSYNPQVRDINGDGMADIWLSAQDYQGAENSNRVLIAGIDGTFTQNLQSELSAVRNTVGGGPAPVAWLEGPDQTYLAALSWQSDHAWAQVRLIGETIV